MKLGISILNNNISPVFDSAHTLRIYRIKDNKIESQRDVNIDSGNLISKTSQIVNTRVNAIICGAVSQQFYSLLQNQGVKLMPWVKGNVQQVLNAYVKGDLLTENFLFPACCQHRRNQRLRRRRRSVHYF